MAAAFLGMAATFSQAQPAPEPTPLADLVTLQAELAQPSKPLTWVISGDSITQGAKWLGRERSYPELIQERVRWEMNRRRDFFVNSAISGEKTAGLRADFAWRVLRFHPDVVSIMIGMNDAVAGPAGRAAFEAELREMVRQVRVAGAIPLLHRTNPVDTDNPDTLTRTDLPAYNEIIAQVAGSTGTILIDHWTRWLEARPTVAGRREWLADPIHPNGAGHRQFAIEFFKAIGRYDSAAASTRP
ncbi:SGNH/GDSL hydrolase family protein [Opitutus sp. GAS368]|uniref:SGNH/GDSL hydrolase family protein n=1 Tax=Opitutus sp. GAS368 TaxID=1882749 RepID=UPI0012FE3188|nr:SGNH/GDSL hydrolase family protein [Opitutus sp. GAS368]